MMELRKWQSECINQALVHYQSNPHFLCQAAPGAGKTAMATELAVRLYEQSLIDFILCFSPSITVSQGFERAFSERLKRRFDGKVGSLGGAYTYQSMVHLGDDFWEVLEHNRVFVIFDEIHHCSGTTEQDSNSWGEEIHTNIKGRASYTLALSGTPWRSDCAPIVLSCYSGDDKQLRCDYRYGLRDAVKDKVCRSPKIVLTDNERLVLNVDHEESKEFTSIKDLLGESGISYQSIILDDNAIQHNLILGCQKLSQIRQHNQSAGGLVVASSVSHAEKILQILKTELNQSAVLVSYKVPFSSEIIEDFRHNDVEWIVSVGMVSEGTDIPRLQVCCHLSHIKTELYFRQVLGRILRVNHSPNQEAWLYTFAEPKLTQFANQIGQDLPEGNVVIRGDSYVGKGGTSLIQGESDSQENMVISSTAKESLEIDFYHEIADPVDTATSTDRMSEGIGLNSTIELLGKFREQVISTFNSPF
jgi:superfamily II DNA or RNA helicase